MERLSFDTRETALLADIVETCGKADEWPLPFALLQQLRDLLHADEVSFLMLDTTLEYVPFHRAVDPSGGGDDSETVIEARSNPFWDTYWTKAGCAYPDITGDYESVTLAADFSSRAARRAREPGGTPIAHMRACLPGHAPGRHYRVLAWRYADGPDFGERDRVALALLRPHIEKAYWTLVATNREPPPLTRRQLELLEWVREGLTNIQIGHRLGISEATVRTHLNHIYERLGISGRTAAVHAVFGQSDGWPMEA